MCCTSNRILACLTIQKISLCRRKRQRANIKKIFAQWREVKRKKKQFLLLCASGTISTRINYNHFGCQSAVILGPAKKWTVRKITINGRTLCSHATRRDQFWQLNYISLPAHRTRYRLMTSIVRAKWMDLGNQNGTEHAISKISVIDKTLKLWRRNSLIDWWGTNLHISIRSFVLCLRLDSGLRAIESIQYACNGSCGMFELKPSTYSRFTHASSLYNFPHS